MKVNEGSQKNLRGLSNTLQGDKVKADGDFTCHIRSH
jgi:hypothetical protein